MKFSRLFLKIYVMPNHVEIVSGLWPFAKHSIIPYKNMSSVEISKFTKQIVITTNDGKTHKYSFGSERKNQRCVAEMSNKL